ncbi:NAD-dependent epimerase/dehydratase family protein [Kineosporia sp. J2-2]|uniref:NAD-dependent epimerase/dehydratase family protein n=1 Tax=Kineosporia corallincola TaxID=2835133 RepID=A0ABS5TB80_9ACTN|nr:NAD-dependent epimerase/dehydratase family protein [Kineosporia corallincola]MBT0768291.1 NAD-dependent epimerase/dehydratase family protein [Kineosporia corallincola]
MSDHVVVLGAGSGLGAVIARRLVAEGRRVTGVTRSGRGVPGGVVSRRADVLDRASLVEVCEGASVVHLATNVPYPDWAARFPVMVDNAIAAAERSGAKLVFADNLYAYGPVDGVITEATPERPAGPKEKLRARLRQTLLGAHASGRARVTIAGISDYYGPDAHNTLPNELLLAPLVRGRNPVWFGPRELPHTFGYAPDTARALIVLGDDARADGRVWNTPAAPTLPVSRFAALAGQVAGRERRLLRMPAATVTLMSLFDRRLRGYGELNHQRTRPWVVDHSAFEQAFGPFRVTGHEEALHDTIGWYRAR